MADARQTPTPAEQLSRFYEQAETQAAQAGERLVGSRGVTGLLGQLAENAAAMTRLSNDALDLVLRNLRLAGRRDVVRLARQLGRTEDKLERVLQEVEELRDELRRAQAETAEADTSAPSPRSSRGARGSTRSANGSGTSAGRRRSKP